LVERVAVTLQEVKATYSAMLPQRQLRALSPWAHHPTIQARAAYPAPVPAPVAAQTLCPFHPLDHTLPPQPLTLMAADADRHPTDLRRGAVVQGAQQLGHRADAGVREPHLRPARLQPDAGPLPRRHVQRARRPRRVARPADGAARQAVRPLDAPADVNIALRP